MHKRSKRTVILIINIILLVTSLPFFALDLPSEFDLMYNLVQGSAAGIYSVLIPIYSILYLLLTNSKGNSSARNRRKTWHSAPNHGMPAPATE